MNEWTDDTGSWATQLPQLGLDLQSTIYEMDKHSLIQSNMY